ncbi:hypothetical protein ACO0QE_003077 [Hanseniaspora vineae]
MSQDTAQLGLHHNLIPFDDTYVLYNANDIFSFLSCYFTLLPIFIMVFYFSWFVITREVEACYMAGGHVVNDIVNNIVKKIIKEPRPFNYFGDSFQQNTIRSGYGMPSAHSQFMGFFAMYVGLRLFTFWETSRFNKIVGTIALITVSFLVAWSRVYLGYHSFTQVGVGLSLGSALASFYFLVVVYVRRTGLSQWFLNWKICRNLYMKDSAFYKPMSLKQEYDAWKIRASDTDEKKKTD